jgi:hypothetical protein
VSWRNWTSRDLFKAGHVYRWIPGEQAIDLGSLEPANYNSATAAR